MNNVYNILKFLTDFHEDGIAKVITSECLIINWTMNS